MKKKFKLGFDDLNTSINDIPNRHRQYYKLTMWMNYAYGLSISLSAPNNQRAVIMARHELFAII
jgi:hypothetical protein